MSDPKRLSEHGGDERHRELLASASDDRPSPASRRAAMVALGIAPAPTGVGAPHASSGWHRLVRWKWVGLAAVTSALTLGALLHQRPAPAATEPPLAIEATPPVSSAPSETQPAPSMAPGELPPPPPPRRRKNARPRVAGNTQPTSTPMHTFEEELALVDTAREAQRDHRAHDALRVLDRHEREFPDGALKPEAELLRIEALLQLNDRVRATSLARRFIASYPQSPLVEKVHALIRSAASD